MPHTADRLTPKKHFFHISLFWRGQSKSWALQYGPKAPNDHDDFSTFKKDCNYCIRNELQWLRTIWTEKLVDLALNKLFEWSNGFDYCVNWTLYELRYMLDSRLCLTKIIFVGAHITTIPTKDSGLLSFLIIL